MLDHRPSIAALRKAVTVPTSPERAFELFTAFMHEWWPLTTHSIAGEEAAGVAFGAGVGGTIVETLANGTSAVWGTITTWDPPRRVAFTWHPGNPQSEAGQVDVTFTAQSPGITLVELVHSGWERRSDGAEARSSYDAGWAVVLNAYALGVGSFKSRR